MQETTEQLSPNPATDDLVAAARSAGDWAGEPVLHNGEDPTEVLAPGTARRNALDEALAELERHSGTQFDPACITALRSILGPVATRGRALSAAA